jgi:methionine-S-sulfoxide reductase
MVHTGATGHAECVRVEYDPSVISYEKLLKVFWSSHDPTSINRQGEDEGPQYRSVIFFHSEEQRKAALESYEQLTRARVFRLPIVTQLVPMQAFFPAEDYHQNYYSSQRRPAARRRKAVVPKAKVVQRKSMSNGKTTQNSPSTNASSTSGSSARSSKRTESGSDTTSSRNSSSRSVEGGAPE